MNPGCFLSKFALVCVLMSVCAEVHAAGSGTIIMNGKRVEVADAYAYRHPAGNDKTVTLTTLIASDRPIDEKKLATSDDRDKVMHALLKQAKAVYWEAVLSADGHLRSIGAVWPGVLEIKGNGDESDLHITRNDAAHLEGWYRTLDEEPKDLMVGVEYFDLKFSVDF